MRMTSEDTGPVSGSLTRAYARLLGNELLPTRAGSLTASAYPLRCRGRIAVPPARLNAYRELLGLPASDEIPPLYPQIAAMPLHLKLLSTPGLPGRTLGVVHLGQIATWHREPGRNEGAMDLAVSLRPGPEHIRGQIFYMTTDWLDGEGQTIWSGESLLLFRGVDGGGEPGENDRVPPSTPVRPKDAVTENFRCPPGIGRSYARVSGDWNPIHLGSMSARLFGFSQPIVHGMWALAKGMVAVENHRTESLAGHQLEAWFTAPLFWPSETCLHVTPEGDWFQIDRDGKRARPAVWGMLSRSV